MTTLQLNPRALDRLLHKSPSDDPTSWNAVTRANGRIVDLSVQPPRAQRTDRAAFERTLAELYGKSAARCGAFDAAWQSWQRGEAAVFPARVTVPTTCVDALQKPRGLTLRGAHGVGENS